MGGDPSARDSVYGRYAGALAKEIAARGTEISDTVNTLYIGGGTPSVLPLSFSHHCWTPWVLPVMAGLLMNLL